MEIFIEKKRKIRKIKGQGERESLKNLAKTDNNLKEFVMDKKSKRIFNSIRVSSIFDVG